MPTPPRSSYFICGTPRSGTWLLCSLLASTGVAGRPHEYFGEDTERENRRTWRVTSFGGYLSCALAAGTTENGVFGSKLMWVDVGRLLERLGGSRLEDVFPDPRFVFLVRDDVVAQAVSWLKAIETGYWHHWDPEGAAEPTFDVDRVDALVQEVNEHNAAWRRWFGEQGIDAFPVRYEDVTRAPETEVRRILAFLGLDLPPGIVVAARTVKTSDALSEDWIARYRRAKLRV